MVKYIVGDLFSHVPKAANSVSIYAHACNCKGVWGAGVAAIFKKKFPSTFTEYNRHCLQHKGELLGTCQLIESSASDPGNNGVPSFVACLFTAPSTGSRQLKSSIIENTDKSLEDLHTQLQHLSKNFEKEDGKIVINMPKINAGLFATPWEQTEAVLLKHEHNFHFNVYVLE